MPATAIEQFLAAQTADTRLWPDDDLVRESLRTAPVYKQLVRARLRMILEALEDDLRTGYGEGQAAPRRLTVEHILPQAWRHNWPLDSDDPQAAQERDRLVHVLGNLTLVSGRLNPALSNRPWTLDGATGKRDYLLEHSALKLNAKVVTHACWTDDDVRTRTAALTDRLLTLWPRPAFAAPTHVSATSFDQELPLQSASEPAQLDSTVASHEGKYRQLWRWLQAQDADELRLSFGQVEQVLDISLPPSARVHTTHWYGYEGTALGRAIRDAGWRATGVDLLEERVTFIRSDAIED